MSVLQNRFTALILYFTLFIPAVYELRITYTSCTEFYSSEAADIEQQDSITMMLYSSCSKEIWRIRRCQGHRQDVGGQESFQNLLKSFPVFFFTSGSLIGTSSWYSTAWRGSIRNGVYVRAAAKKKTKKTKHFQKGNSEKRHRYAKAHKYWNEDQWIITCQSQLVLKKKMCLDYN